MVCLQLVRSSGNLTSARRRDRSFALATRATLLSLIRCAGISYSSRDNQAISLYKYGTCYIGKGHKDSGMDGRNELLLVSPDLMSTSRIAGLARDIGMHIETLRNLRDSPKGGPFSYVLIDLQSVPGNVTDIILRIRSVLDSLPTQAEIPYRLIAFGPHVHKQKLEEALAAGVDASVSRGELFGGFSGLLDKWSS